MCVWGPKVTSAARISPSSSPKWRRILGLTRREESDRAQQMEPLRQLDGEMSEVVAHLAPDDQLLVALRWGSSLTVAQVARLTRQSKASVRLRQLQVLRTLQNELETRAAQ